MITVCAFDNTKRSVNVFFKTWFRHWWMFPDVSLLFLGSGVCGMSFSFTPDLSVLVDAAVCRVFLGLYQYCR